MPHLKPYSKSAKSGKVSKPRHMSAKGGTSKQPFSKVDKGMARGNNSAVGR